MTNTQLLEQTIQSLGINKCYKGYRQLIISIELALDNETRLLNITKEIYYPAADLCNCNICNIERNIRTIINRAWNINSKRLSEIAGYTLISSSSVSEFISILVAYTEQNNSNN